MPKCPLCGHDRELGEHCADGHPEVKIHTKTYVYADYRHNLIVDPDNIAIRSKAEKDSRVAHENSEDALTWNVFRGIQSLETLDEVSAQIFDTTGPVEPYFWTVNARGESWQPLLQAFDVLEAHIPPQRQRSEPDIALVNEHRRCVIFIEAKFGADVQEKNPPDWFLAKDGAYTPEYRDCILANYQKGDPDHSLFSPGLSLAEIIDKRFYQLMRHALFANYLTRDGDCRGWRWTLCSLISPGTNRNQTQQCRAFWSLLAPKWQGRYEILTWADVYQAIPVTARRSRAEERLRQSIANYLENKTYNDENAGLIAG